MNIKKLTKAVSSVLLLSAAVLTGCQRENDGRLILATETFSSDNSKLIVDGTHSIWANGDQVRINSGVYEVAVNGSNEASLSGVPGADAFYAVYPGSLCGNLTSASTTLNLPATYLYRTNGSGKQILELPMVGYLDPHASNGPLYLKHATGAIVVRVFNLQNAGNMTLDCITISSNSYKLNGSLDVNVSNPTPAAGTTSNDDEKSVTILFNNEKPSIAYNSYVDVMVPIPAVPSANRFTVYVATHNRKNRFYHTRTSNKNGNLNRNQIGYAEVNMRTSSAYVSAGEILDMDGSGNYLIQSKDDFMFLVEACNEGWNDANGNSYSSRNYIISNSFDMSGSVVESIHNFSGQINGNGNTISNLTIETDYVNNQGRIGMISTSTRANVVTNLTLSNVSLKYTGSNASVYMGGLIGYYASTTTITNCHVYGLTADLSNYTGQTLYVGGLMGATNNEIILNNCSASDIVWAPGSTSKNVKMRFGGLVGHGRNSVNIQGGGYTATTGLCLNNSSGAVIWGGLIAHGANAITANTCDVTSKVDYFKGTTGEWVGGIVGYLTNNPAVNVDMTTIGGTVDIYGTHAIYGPVVGNGTSSGITGSYTNSINFIQH